MPESPTAATQTSQSGVPHPGRNLARAALATLGISGMAAAVLSGLTGFALYQFARARGAWGEGEPPEGCYEEVEFTSPADGTRLCGWFLRAATIGPAPTVIICHGIYTGRREGLPWGLRLRETGFNVLCFDFRAHGGSGGQFISVGHRETEDVLGAVAYVKQRPEVDPRHIGVLGFSMGAAAALSAASRCEDIAAVVADSSYASFLDAMYYSFGLVVGGLPNYPFIPLAVQMGRLIVHTDARQLRPVDHIARLAGRPVFIIHGEQDNIVPLRHAHLLYDAAQSPKQLWLVPEAHHVGARDLHPAEYLARVSGFFASALGTARALSAAA